MPTLTVSIIADADNGYDDNTNGNWRSGAQTGSGELGNDSVNTYHGAFRFQNITIPKGATINSATLKIHAGSLGPTTGIQLKLQGIAEDNTAAFSTTFQGTDPIGRAGTTAVVTGWSPSGGSNTDYTSPDISSIIQEIVNRTGWASGNALGLFILDNSSPAHDVMGFQIYSSSFGTSNVAVLTIDYSVSNTISKTLQYEIILTPAALTKLLRYSIEDQELTPVAFRGLKVAKPGHNVLNTKNPNNLNFSTDYNTLKYYLSGVLSIAVNESLLANTYSKTVTLTHGLGFYPVCLAYVQDDRMANPQPMGRFQAGSGASRSFYYTISKTQITFMVNGFWLTTPDTYTVYFYYKVFKNNIGL